MVDFAIYIGAAVLVFAFVKEVFFEKGKGWKVVEPAKSGGSFSIYYKDKHIANIRGKNKASVLLAAIQGKDTTSSLEMPAKKAVVKKAVVKTVKPVVKPVVKKVSVAKKAVAKKTPVVKKAVAKRAVKK